MAPYATNFEHQTSPHGFAVKPHDLGQGFTSASPRRGKWEEHRMDWRHEAACRDEDPELFFPIGNTGPALIQIEEAKRVCRSCTVMDSCLQWAMDTSQEAGVWGGMSEDDRRLARRRTVRVQSA